MANRDHGNFANKTPAKQSALPHQDRKSCSSLTFFYTNPAVLKHADAFFPDSCLSALYAACPVDDSDYLCK
jgi:hypothetical protein